MKKTVYEIMTDRIVEKMKDGQIPWLKEWHGAAGGAYNYGTNRPYNFINQCLLRYSGGYVTFNQGKKNGWHLQAGSKAEQVYQFFAKTYRLDSKETTEEEETEEDNTFTKFSFTYTNVFPITAWIDENGNPIQEKKATERIEGPAAIKNGEMIIQNYLKHNGPELRVLTTDEAYYSPSADMVHIPKLNQYDNAAAYYSTAFHELTHSTGHSSRLNRLKSGEFGSHEYSKEELVAEIGAAYLMHIAGIETERTFKNSVAYLQSWIKALQDHPKWIAYASAQAEKAAKLICQDILTADNTLIIPDTEEVTEETENAAPAEQSEKAEKPVTPAADPTPAENVKAFTLTFENCTGVYNLEKIACLNIPSFKKFKKSWIDPAEQKEQAEKALITILENNKHIPSRLEKLTELTGKKPAACKAGKAIKKIVTSDRFMIEKVENHYMLANADIALKVTEETFYNTVKLLNDSIPDIEENTKAMFTKHLSRYDYQLSTPQIYKFFDKETIPAILKPAREQEQIRNGKKSVSIRIATDGNGIEYKFNDSLVKLLSGIGTETAVTPTTGTPLLSIIGTDTTAVLLGIRS